MLLISMEFCIHSSRRSHNAVLYNDSGDGTEVFHPKNEQLSEHVQLEMFLPEAEVDLADGGRLGRILDVTGCSDC